MPGSSRVVTPRIIANCCVTSSDWNFSSSLAWRQKANGDEFAGAAIATLVYAVVARVRKGVGMVKPAWFAVST
jgi:hypothetical protein